MAQKVVKGRVLDDHNEPAVGASVKVSGTNIGAQTDLDGNFEIEIPEKNSGKLDISYLGSAPKTVAATDGVVVKLDNQENILGTVEITTPYGPPVSKEQFVGSADVITAKKFENTPVSDITKAIEGGAPGVQVSNGSGMPGSGAAIQIRGRGSLSASTSPLIVLDGAPYDGDITSINPMDVASMNILKDAMATSLYGSRGSNGVILITTKRGRAGEKPKITIDGKMGTVNRGLPNYNVMTDPGQYYEAAWNGQLNTLVTAGYKLPRARTDASGISSTVNSVVDQLGYNTYRINGVGDSLVNSALIDPATGKLNPNAVLKYKDDWQKAVQRVGLRQDYNFNISGATDKSDYYLSAGYLNEKGYIVGTDYDRFTTRLNVNTQATDWLKVGLNFSGSMSTQNGPNTDAANTGNPSWVSLSTAPVFPVYYRDANNNTSIDPVTGKTKLDYGSPNSDPTFSGGQRAYNPGSNILGSLQSDQTTSKYKNMVVIPYVQAKITKDLTFITRLNASYTNLDYVAYDNRTHGQYKDVGLLIKQSANTFSYTWNQLLTYQKTFGEMHDLTVTAGHENYSMNSAFTAGTISGFASDAFREFTVATGTPTIDSKTDNDRLESYLAVANYTFNHKYLLQASVRRDGLSRFSQDSRWGNFGGFGGGWILSEESFLKGVKWINNLKLKASYGTNGNSGVITNGAQNYYAYQALYDLSRPNGSNPSAIPVSVSNNNLKWEAQKAVNVGTEFTLFSNIVSGEVNVYNRQTSNLYYNVPNPVSTGIITQLLNTGSMYNRGIEVNLYVTPVKTKDFTWSFNTNWTTYKNRITKLAPGLDSVITTNNTILKPGYDFTSFYLVHSSGVNHANGSELYDYIDPKTGNIKQTTKYNDSALAFGGRSIVGNATPKFSGAITNTFQYKGFELSFLISYSVGGKYYDATYQALMGASNGKIGGTNYSKDIVGAWTQANQTSNIPKLAYGDPDNNSTSDRYLIDASYISIRNINLRYSFPSQMVKKAGFSSLSAYVAGDNIAFFSKRKGMNPQGSNDFSGQVAYPYAPARTIMCGLTVGL
jgi:TonB-linked SusC/RagA family outer membrane protein